MKTSAEIKRALKGIGIILFGFNFVGLAIVQNGWNFTGNPTWEFIKAFWYFEVAVLAIAIVVAIFLLIILFVSTEHALCEKTSSFIETEGIPKVPIEPAERKQIVPSIEKSKLTAQLHKPPVPPLSKEELKRKALRQITGKEF